MAFFGKKTNKEAENLELDVADIAEGGKGEVKIKKGWNPLSHLKKKMRVTFKLRFKRKGSSGSDDSGEDATQSGSSEHENKKPKKEKKEKVKKEKVKKEKPEKTEVSDEGGEKKRKPFIWIIIAVSSLAVGVAAFFIVTAVTNKPTVDGQLMEAQLLLNHGEFDKANKIYVKLLKQDDKLVAAYLGRADALAGTDKAQQAIEELTVTLPFIENNQDIQAKIVELTTKLAESAESGAEETAESSTDAESEAGAESSTESEAGDETASEKSESSVAAVEPIVFVEPNLEKAIREVLQKSPEDPITDTDLSAISTLKILGPSHVAIDESIKALNKADGYIIDGVTYTERGTIKKLDDLKYFKNLRKLTIAYNAVSDISGIADLENLDTLGLYCNEITDISSLSRLKNLRFLYLYNNNISDISPLASLTSLQQLWLNINHITDISAVKNMPELTELFINHNEIKDISPAANLKKLGFLYANDNQISDISTLKDLESLAEVSFLNNPVTDLSPVNHVRYVNRPFV